MKEEYNNNEEKKPEVIEKTFWQKKWQQIAALAAIIVLHFLTEISLWYIAIIAVYIVATSIMSEKQQNLKLVANVMHIVLVIALLNSGLNMILPRMAQKRSATWAKFDQGISNFMVNDIEVQTVDMFNSAKLNADSIFRSYYKKLLDQGKLQEAADTLISYNKFWDYKSHMQKAKRKNTVYKTVSKVEPNKENEILKQLKTIESPIKDSIFFTGEYVLSVKGMTDFYVIPRSTKKRCETINISSEDYNYEIVFPDGQIYRGSATAFIRRKLLKFRLRSIGDEEIIHLKVS